MSLLTGPPLFSPEVADMLCGVARPLEGSPADYDFLMDLAGDAHFVLLGEASHGTHEFYFERAEITKRLIREKGVTAVAVEADWPDAYQINRYVRGAGAGTEAGALAAFKRFPAWMWRNSVVLDFVGWLREHNDTLPRGASKVGFYGLDLYSLYTSIEAVVHYLERIDPDAAGRARRRYSCFEHFAEDSHVYGYAAGWGLAESCEDDAVRQLIELQRRAADYARREPGAFAPGCGRIAADEFFFAEQNARLVKNAEEYYRATFRGGVSSWNLRDRHMAETLEALRDHLQRHEGETNSAKPRIVVWEHNSHIGDARATEMGRRQELNVGQLVRERHGAAGTLLVGFTTYSGTVTAASDWGGPAERKRVLPALPESYEALFHELGLARFGLALRRSEEAAAELRRPRLERAIGVIYRPETERASHYFRARLADQFDCVLHFDKTRALEPLERTAQWESGEIPETFPTGL